MITKFFSPEDDIFRFFMIVVWCCLFEVSFEIERLFYDMLLYARFFKKNKHSLSLKLSLSLSLSLSQKECGEELLKDLRPLSEVSRTMAGNQNKQRKRARPQTIRACGNPISNFGSGSHKRSCPQCQEAETKTNMTQTENRASYC